MRIFILYSFLFMLIWANPGFSADVSQEFHDVISKLYNFQPRTLSDEELSQKSGELDIFWNKVKSNTGLYLPLLRKELMQAPDDSFFLYDGSMLLLQVSESQEDKLLALKAIPRCALTDVKKTDYFFTVHRFAVEGLDTSELAFKILEDRKFFTTPEEDLILAQNYSLIWMLVPTQENYYLEKAISRLNAEKSRTAQKSLLLLLYFTATDMGDAAILEFRNNEAKPASTRKYAQILIDAGQRAKEDVSDIKELLPEISAFVSPDASVEDLKSIRRQRMHNINKAAVKEVDQLTYLLRKRRK